MPPNSPEIGQVFDISKDPFEKKRRGGDYPEIVQNLRRELEQRKGFIDDDPKNW